MIAGVTEDEVNRWMRRALLAATAWCVLLAPAAQAADPPEVQNLSADRYFTPNGDGNEDIARVTFGLTEPATVDVTIADTNGTVVRKALNHAPQPDSWNSSAFEWNGLDNDGTEAPAGQYTYTVRAETSSGATATATGHIGIVRSVPAQLTAPAAGATLSGDVDARLVPTPGYTLSSVQFYSREGASLSPFSLPKGQDGSYSYRVNSALMANGDNRLEGRMVWYDAFNQYHYYTAQVPVTVSNPVRFSGLSRDAAFSPNGDGVEDVTTTSVRLANGAADITVRVLDADGAPVKTLFSGQHDPFVNLTWDGTDADGTPMPDGEYDIEIAGTNASGTTMTVRSVAIDTQVIGAFTAPAPGQSLIGTAHVAFVPRTGLHINSINFSGMCRSSQPYRCQLAYAGFSDLDGTWGADIDSTRLQDGPEGKRGIGLTPRLPPPARTSVQGRRGRAVAAFPAGPRAQAAAPGVPRGCHRLHRSYRDGPQAPRRLPGRSPAAWRRGRRWRESAADVIRSRSGSCRRRRRAPSSRALLRRDGGDEMHEMLDDPSGERPVLAEIGDQQRHVDDHVGIEQASGHLGVEDAARAGAFGEIVDHREVVRFRLFGVNGKGMGDVDGGIRIGGGIRGDHPPEKCCFEPRLKRPLGGDHRGRNSPSLPS